MIRYIIKALQNSDSVFVSDLGTFTKSYTPAHFEGNNILPPQFIVTLDPNTEHDEMGFTNFVGREKQCLITQANAAISTWVEELKNALDHNKSITFDEFGTFERNSKGEIHFSCAHIAELNQEFEGMGILNTKGESPVVPVPVDVPVEEPTAEQTEETIPEPIEEIPTPEPVVAEPIAASVAEPVVETPAEPEEDIKPIWVPEPTPEPTPEPVVETPAEPEEDIKPIWIPEPTPEPTPEPVVETPDEPEEDIKPIWVPEPTPEPTPEPVVETPDEPEEDIKPIWVPEPTPEPTPEPVVEEPVVAAVAEPVAEETPAETEPEIEEDDTLDEDINDTLETGKTKKKRHWGWLIVLLILAVLAVLGYFFRNNLVDVFQQVKDKVTHKTEVVEDPQPEAEAAEPVTETQPEEVTEPELYTPEVIKTSADQKYRYINFESGHYYAIAGSFPSEADVLTHIRQKGLDKYDIYLVKQEGVSNIRVCIGIFNTEEEAESFAKGVNPHYWVLK